MHVALDGVRLSADEGMVLRSDLKLHPELCELQVLRMPQGTTYSVSPEQERLLLDLWQTEGRERVEASVAFELPTVEELGWDLPSIQPTTVEEVREHLDLLRDRLADRPQLTDDSDVRLIMTRIHPRDAAFRIAVRRLYDGRCAICGSCLTSPTGQPEVQSAHIYPKARNGSDDVRNGLCLCRRHHWAFDAGWIAVSDDLRVMVRRDVSDTEDYGFIRDFAGIPLNVPTDQEATPHPIFLRAHRALWGFDNACLLKPQ